MLQYIRIMGQAAVMDDGSILLLGGQYQPGCGHNEPGCTGFADEQTVERVTPDGRSEVVFTLLHGDNKQGCAVQPVPGGEVILLGGGGSFWIGGEPHAHVERYDQTGHLGSLPDLLQPRFEHACGFFNNWQDKPVLMVAGGAVDQLTKDTATATTEFLKPRPAFPVVEKSAGVLKPWLKHIGQRSEVAGLIVPLHVGVVLSSDPKGTTAPQQDHLSPRYGLHSAALLVVPVQECENHFRPSVRGHPLHCLLLGKSSAAGLVVTATHLILASKQEDTSVGHNSGLAHHPDVLGLRIVPPLRLAVLPGNAARLSARPAAHHVAAARHQHRR